MSLTVTKLKAADVLELARLGGRTYVQSLTPEQEYALDNSPMAWTVHCDFGVLACGGVYEYWQGRGEAWAVFHPHCRRHFLALHNVVKRFLELCPVRRIEAAVDVDFEAGHRWVKALGFELEAPGLRAFFPDGKSASLYSRIREA